MDMDGIIALAGRLRRMSKPSRRAIAVVLPLLLVVLTSAAHAATPAEELLAQSIAHHDPDGAWERGGLRLELFEDRPGGSDRETVVTLGPTDHPDGQAFGLRWAVDGEVREGRLHGESCTWTVDGSPDIPDARREELNLTCDRLAWLRNYYSYVWGLPMKLGDPGTRLAPEVTETTFEGSSVLAVRVDYDPEVGGDSWDVFFDPDTAAMVGYRFFHDRDIGDGRDGEWITLNGEVEASGLRLPAVRAWYTNAEDRLLGTDTLRALEVDEMKDLGAADR
jgi:hypothetical protein